MGQTQTYPESIVVDEYLVRSNLVVKVAGQNYVPRTEHLLRVERFVPKGTLASKILKIDPTLCDFDNFMRGNPYPRIANINL